MVVLKLVSLEVARIVMLWLGRRFGVEGSGDGDNACICVDGKESAGVIIEWSKSP